MNNSAWSFFEMRPQLCLWQMGRPTAANRSACNIQDVCDTHAHTHTRAHHSYQQPDKGGASQAHRGSFLNRKSVFSDSSSARWRHKNRLHKKSGQVWKRENESNWVTETLKCISVKQIWNKYWISVHLFKML